MKAITSNIISAYTKLVSDCIEEIKKIDKTFPDEETKAHKTKKLIDKWFRTGGIIK